MTVPGAVPECPGAEVGGDVPVGPVADGPCVVEGADVGGPVPCEAWGALVGGAWVTGARAVVVAPDQGADFAPGAGSRRVASVPGARAAGEDAGSDA